MNELDQLKILSESIQKLEEGTYWNSTGTYQKEAEELGRLVPNSGPSKTLRGEIFRAAQKIYYDYNNNGFGNSWQEPATFLMNHVDLSDDVNHMLVRYGAGNIAQGDIDDLVEKMLDETVAQIYNMRDERNDEDMWDTPFNRYDFEEEAEEDPWDDDPEDEYDDQEDDDYWRARD